MSVVIAMTEKRFTRVEFSNGIWGVKDNNTEYEYPSPIDLLDLLNSLHEENEIKNEELIQKKLTNVLLAKIYVAQLSLNPNLPYVEQSLENEMRLLDKKIRELCGDVFNE